MNAVVLSLAWFAGVNAIGSALAASLALVTPEGRNDRARPAIILLVRLLPAGLSLLFVTGVFLPAQWALEPRETGETLGIAWYVLAAAGAVLLARSARRAFSVARASRFVTSGPRLRGVAEDTYAVDGLSGVSLAGIIKPRILVGRAISAHLTAAELDVAIAHEVAHRDACDNLARWCMLCAPDFLSGSAIAARLEQSWHAGAESRADAKATRGDETRAIHLASALIKVARCSALPNERAVPSWSTLNDSELLEWRVQRLLSGPLVQNRSPLQAGAAIGIVTIGLLILAPAFAESVHRLTEVLVACLP
jgi:hypothetical protein